MKEYDEIYNIVKSKLSEYRFHHSECVSKRCVELAKKYNIDINRAKLVGIAHDIAKELSDDEKIKYCQENNIEIDDIEIGNLGLLHAKIGADIGRKKFGFDEEMCSAISCHTTGKENMTMLEKILYIADVSGEDRNFPDKGYVIDLSNKNIDECMIYTLEICIIETLKKRKTVHENSIKAFNYLLRK